MPYPAIKARASGKRLTLTFDEEDPEVMASAVLAYEQRMIALTGMVGEFIYSAINMDTGGTHSLMSPNATHSPEELVDLAWRLSLGWEQSADILYENMTALHPYGMRGNEIFEMEFHDAVLQNFVDPWRDEAITWGRYTYDFCVSVDCSRAREIGTLMYDRAPHEGFPPVTPEQQLREIERLERAERRRLDQLAREEERERRLRLEDSMNE
mgnify:CR=1 FL=1